ncbi:hypothetical protein [Bacteroides uniformis]|uniref:hypothetical protein n=1 Tax=Bacteroides uniformis TaxID=820 RepID=UPI001E4F72A4|nr:hypothetical protein [Bacteroides uniformis]MDC1984185.1 hypothetical protein [Bacteroides uniformis]MDC1988408.1 hypothetical protein [Bacteroides uniformis]
MSEIKKIGSFSFVDTAAGQYAINMNWSQSMSQFFNAGSQDWDGDPVSVAGVRWFHGARTTICRMPSVTCWRRTTWVPVFWTVRWGCCMGRGRCFTG